MAHETGTARGLVSPWYRPMVARDIREPHRAATPLELLFDLCFVVAIALAVDRFHHAIGEGNVWNGLAAYLVVFFAIWWAWMNFTWFASAYDTDDVPYRWMTLVQISGVLIVAAGVPAGFDRFDFTVATIGYTVMRLGLVGQWLRAARGHVAGRRTALRYATAISACSVVWMGLLLLPVAQRILPSLVMIALELTVPVFAESAGRTPWNPSHIAERYSLFTLIVLGETVLTTTIAVQAGLGAGGAAYSLLVVAGSGLLIVFGMWWLYFGHPAAVILVSNRVGFAWGYGHYPVFVSAAAVGAGLAVAVDHETGATLLAPTVVGAAVAVPLASFLFAVWSVHVRPHKRGRAYDIVFLGTAAVVLVTPFAPFALPMIAFLVTFLVLGSTAKAARGSRFPSPADRTNPDP